MRDPASRFVTIKHAAAEVGVSRRTIYNWLRLGKLQYQRHAGGAVRIDAASLWRTKDGAAHGADAP